MLNLFRRHVAGCGNHGSRTGQKCPKKPPCPIHYEGVDGQGRKIKPQALVDPRTGNGIRDWARACEVIRDMEAPAPVIVAETRTPISKAVEHFRNTKLQTSTDRQRKVKNLLCRFQAFMEANPRNHQFIMDVKFHDLTDFMSTWVDASTTQRANRELLIEFLKYCYKADFIPKNIGEDLPTIHDNSGPAEPFEPEELEELWKVLPDFPDEYGRTGQPIAKQTEAFVYIMRYTGLDVSTTLNA